MSMDTWLQLMIDELFECAVTIYFSISGPKDSRIRRRLERRNLGQKKIGASDVNTRVTLY
jgi:hypothetical protein